MSETPMSLRTLEAEKDYQKAKQEGKTVPLELEPAIKKWEHWRLIDNRFPYNSCFEIHHMLMLKRAGISERWQLNDVEKREFETIIKEFIYPNYDLWFENSPRKRSVPLTYHVHLGKYLGERLA